MKPSHQRVFALLSIAGHDWSIDATPVRGAISAMACRRHALAVNLKHERRRPRRRRQGMTDAMSELSRRSRLRLADACRTYAAHVAAYAGRQRAAQVEYDDCDRSALPSFPWHQLREAIAHKLDERGMRLIHVNAVSLGADADAAAANGRCDGDRRRGAGRRTRLTKRD